MGLKKQLEKQGETNNFNACHKYYAFILPISSFYFIQKMPNHLKFKGKGQTILLNVKFGNYCYDS